MKIGFQGQIGAFSDQATSFIFPKSVKVGMRTFSDVFKAVDQNRIDGAIIPIENTSIGTITQSYDLLDEYDLMIFIEYYMPIEHSLIGWKGTNLDKVETVYSHPAALNQCQKFLSLYPQWQLIPFSDTAGAVGHIRNNKNLNSVAIAAGKTAGIYGLTEIQSKINDYPHNETRFIGISNKENRNKFRFGEADKMSLVIRLDHHAGALHDCLSVMSMLNINLTNLISRPDKENPWSYVFFMDLMLNLNEEKYKIMMENLNFLNIQVKILGDYCNIIKDKT